MNFFIMTPEFYSKVVRNQIPGIVEKLQDSKYTLDYTFCDKETGRVTFSRRYYVTFSQALKIIGFITFCFEEGPGIALEPMHDFLKEIGIQ